MLLACKQRRLLWTAFKNRFLDKINEACFSCSLFCVCVRVCVRMCVCVCDSQLHHLQLPE